MQHQPISLAEAGTRAPTADQLDLLVVKVGGHSCGLPAAAVVEIHRAVRLVCLPDAPDVVAGLLNRRGTALPVLSLRRRLGVPDKTLQADDHLVILRLPERPVGLLVDAAVDVLTVAATDVDEAATTGAAHTRGVVVLRDGLLVLADLSSFLSLDEEAVLEQSVRAVSA